MAYGPLEYFIIEFQGHKFSGEILPALKAADDSGEIRIVDLLFVSKDRSGNVTALEHEDFDEQTASAFASLNSDDEGLFSSQDVDEIGNMLENDSSAALVLIEHVWATHLRDSILRANGRLIYNDYVTQDTLGAAAAAS